jgi:hypothetical protein
MTTIKAPASDGHRRPFVDHRQRQAARLHAAGRVNVGRGAVGAVIACVTGASRAVSDFGQPTNLGHAAPPHLADDPDAQRRKTSDIMILTTQVPWN